MKVAHTSFTIRVADMGYYSGCCRGYFEGHYKRYVAHTRVGITSDF